MRFPPQYLDELRARLPVSEVVGRRVKLKKAGREWKGLSPFNQEKTPSFFVNDQKGMWFDFSAGRNGDIFSFVMETEGVSFAEAVERLAGLAGIALPIASKEGEAREQRRKSLYEIVELAAKFFEASLASRTGAHARGYLADRAIAPELQVQFRLGYAPAERFALKEHLGAKGIAVEDMIETGLLVAGEDIPVPYDRFRERLIFPITDLRGRVVAFGGRALDENAQPKYLNSPETPLFHKGWMLYNGGAARQAAHRGATVVVVEGYIDTIAMVSAGFEATVAPLGTALTEDQLALLWKMADEPVLCFDGDKAGKRAAYRAVDLALPLLSPGKSLRFAQLPAGRDPDDLVHAGGRAAVEEVVNGAQPLADILWQRESETGRFDTPERRAALEARLGEIAALILDEAVRKHYRRHLDARLREFFADPAGPALIPTRWSRDRYASRPLRPSDRRRSMAGAMAGPQVVPRSSPRLVASPIVRGSQASLRPREALILRALVNHPWLLENHAEDIAALEFRHPDAERLRLFLLEAAASHITHADALAEAIAARGLSPVLARVQTALTHSSDWPARPGAAAKDVERWFAHVITLHRKTGALHRELKDAERALGSEPSEENLAWMRDVQERLAVLEGTEAEIEGFGASSGRAARSL